MEGGGARTARLVRQALGLGVCGVGTAVLLRDLYLWLGLRDPRMAGALLGGLFAAGATALGTLPVALSQNFSRRAYAAMLGFGAGVMLAATSFSLVVPALRAAREQGASSWAAGGIVSVAMLLGAAFLLVIDRVVSHEHFIKGHEGPSARALKRAWLFVFAISLHNMPEGLTRSGRAHSPPASRSRMCPKAWWWRWHCAAWAMGGRCRCCLVLRPEWSSRCLPCSVPR